MKYSNLLVRVLSANGLLGLRGRLEEHGVQMTADVAGVGQLVPGVELQRLLEPGHPLDLERHVDDGRGEQALARLHVQGVLHEGGLEDVAGEGEDGHAGPADPGVAAEEAVCERVADVVADGVDHLDLEGLDLVLGVGVVAHVDEVVEEGRDALVDLSGDQTRHGAHQLQTGLGNLEF